VELADVSGFTCCPEPTGFSLHEKLTWLTVAARNISLAEEQGLDILTLCNGCYYTLKHTVDELEDPTLRGKVNEALAKTGHQYARKAKVRHFIQVLAEELGRPPLVVGILEREKKDDGQALDGVALGPEHLGLP